MITRKQIEEIKGMTVGHMEMFCPDRLEAMKAIVGDEACLFWNDADFEWMTTGGKPSWHPLATYFPTEAQLDAHFAPKKKINQKVIDLLKQAIQALEAK